MYMETELEKINERNKRVELDKAWEIRIADPFINALVPTGGYLLSTLSLSFVKQWWINEVSSN
jgi:hypothetical protein